MQIAASLFSYNSDIYKYGGYGFWSHRDFITRFERETKEWELVPFDKSDVLPRGRENAIVKVIEDDLYIIGGYTLPRKNPLLSPIQTYDIWRFNMISGIWTSLGNIKKYIGAAFRFSQN
jgi:hypothetical protein